MRLGIIPTLNEVLRVIVWLLVTILYAGFWLAFGLLLSVVMRRAASAALVGFGTWLGVILFGAFLLPLLANTIFPANVTGSADDYFASTTTQQLFLRISPATLYQDAVTAIMNPAARDGPGRRQPAAVRLGAGADPVAAVARPEHAHRLAADRGARRIDRRPVRPGVRDLPAAGSARLIAVMRASSARPRLAR